MRWKREEVAKLATLIFKGLTEKKVAVVRGTSEEVISRIAATISHNLEEEESIEEEVKKIMERYRAQIASGSVDPQKAYMMIKKQVAKDRKFIL